MRADSAVLSDSGTKSAIGRIFADAGSTTSYVAVGRAARHTLSSRGHPADNVSAFEQLFLDLSRLTQVVFRANNNV